MMSYRLRSCVCFVAVVLGAAIYGGHLHADVSVVDSVFLGPTGGNGLKPNVICCDDSAGRVYVANDMSRNVSVIGIPGDTVVAVIGPTHQRPEGICVNRATGRVYVTASLDTVVTVIDGGLNRVVCDIPLGSWPIGLDVNELTNVIYIAVRDDNRLAVVSGDSNSIVRLIDMPIRPQSVSVNDSTGRVYVTCNDVLVVVDGSTNSVIDTIRYAPSPASVCVNVRTNRVYVAGSNGVVVMDGATDDSLATVPCGPGRLCVDEATNMIYGSAGCIINGNTNQYVGWFEGGDDLCVHSTTSKLYAPHTDGDLVWVYPAGSEYPADTVLIGVKLMDVAANPATGRVYVAYRNESANRSQLKVIDGVSGSVLDSVTLGLPAWAVDVYPGLNRVYATTGDRVVAVDGVTNQILANIRVDGFARGICASPTGLVYAGSFIEGTVSVIDANTNTRVDSIPVAGTVNRLCTDPGRGLLYCGAGDSVVVFDLASRSRVAAVFLSRVHSGYEGTSDVVFNSSVGRVYGTVGSYSSPFVYVVDAGSNLLVDSINIGGLAAHIAIDESTNTAYAASFTTSEVAVFDCHTNAVRQRLPLGGHLWHACCNSNLHRAYVVSYDKAAVYFLSEVPGIEEESKVNHPVTRTAKLCAVPNPTNGSFALLFNVPVDEHATVDVLDATGRVVSRPVSADLLAGEYRFACDRRRLGIPLRTGVYLVRLSLGGSVATQKLVVQP